MARPTVNEYPSGRHICLVCGAAWGFDWKADDDKQYNEFKDEHALCATLDMPATECVVDGCRSTAIGAMQRCPTHGGDRLAVDRETRFLMQKCKLSQCGAVALTKNILCQKHWSLVPWQCRRHVSRLLRKNDMVPTRAYDECMQRAYGFVVKSIKESERSILEERF